MDGRVRRQLSVQRKRRFGHKLSCPAPGGAQRSFHARAALATAVLDRGHLGPETQLRFEVHGSWLMALTKLGLLMQYDHGP